MTQVLATNGSPHPPRKWALATAELIIDDTALYGDRYVAAQQLKLKIAEILATHHALNQIDERTLIAKDPTIILDGYHFNRLDDAVRDVIQATRLTEWHDHFEQAAVIGVVTEIIGKHFATAQKIERLWFAETHPDSLLAKTYKSQAIEGII